jgi:CheY-like chemotaxis protein
MGTPQRAPHEAFFYATEDAYLAHVVSFVLRGLRDRERVLVFTTNNHWDEIGSRMEAAGIDWVRATQRRALMFADAEHIASETVVGGIFQPSRLEALLRRLVPDGPFQRFYGDVAGMLASARNLPATIAAEHACQHAASARGITVSCGYDLRSLPDADSEWPVRSVMNAHEDAAVQPGAWGGRPPASGDGRKAKDAELILLWGDHADSQTMYAEALTLCGYRVITAFHAVEALTLTKAYRPHLLVIDTRAPANVGLKALRHLRADHVDTPILALISHAFDTGCMETFRRGFNVVLSKPCLPDDLVAAVTGTLAQAD